MTLLLLAACGSETFTVGGYEVDVDKKSAQISITHGIRGDGLSNLRFYKGSGESEIEFSVGSYKFTEIDENLRGSASVDRIVAFSPHERDAMMRLYQADASTIELIPCGVDLSLFRPLDQQEVRQCPDALARDPAVHRRGFARPHHAGGGQVGAATGGENRSEAGRCRWSG